MNIVIPYNTKLVLKLFKLKLKYLLTLFYLKQYNFVFKILGTTETTRVEAQEL